MFLYVTGKWSWLRTSIVKNTDRCIYVIRIIPIIARKTEWNNKRYLFSARSCFQIKTSRMSSCLPIFKRLKGKKTKCKSLRNPRFVHDQVSKPLSHEEPAVGYESPKSSDGIKIFIFENFHSVDRLVINQRKTTQNLEAGPQLLFPFVVVFGEQTSHTFLAERVQSPHRDSEMIGANENADSKSTKELN